MWQEIDNSLDCTLKFRNFREAFSFMTEVALMCEKMDHHPTWNNIYNIVIIKLNTHSAGNIVTDKDRKLAEQITKVYTKYQN